MTTYFNLSLPRKALHVLRLGLCLIFCYLLSPGTLWAQLQGNYTIGSGGDYPDFSSAVADLEVQGISADVTFLVQAGTYRERVVINRIPGSSCDVTVTFKGDAPVEEVILQEAGSGGTPAALQINGADGIRISGLSIITENFGIDITEGTDCFVLENSVLKYDDGFYNKYLVRSIATEAESNDHHIIRNNTFVGAEYAIFRTFQNEFQLPDHIADEGIVVENNQFYNQARFAMRLSRQRDFSITDNSLYNVRYGISLNHSWYGKEISRNKFISDFKYSASAFALSLVRSSAHRIEKNYVNFLSGGSGISIEAGKNYEQEMIIANNVISITGYDMNQEIGDAIVGLSIRKNHSNPNSTQIKIYHNTILLEGDNVSPVVAFLSTTDHNPLFIYNNNISSQVGGTLLDIEDPGVIAEMDYNNLRLSGSTNFAQYAEQEVNSLAAWQQISGFDANSISVFPGTVFQPSAALQGEGINLPEVQEDYFSETRSDPPTIGAVEGNIGSALKGVYTVGESEDFETLAAAVEALERFGAEDSLVLKLSAGSYPEQIILDGSYGARSITIAGVEDDSTAAVIGAQGATDAMVIRNSTAKFTLQDLNIRGLFLRNVSNLRVESNVIEGGIGSYANRVEETNSNLAIHNNRFLDRGVSLNRRSARDSFGRSVRKGSVDVTNNTFEKVEERAISIRLHDGITVNENKISTTAVSTSIGIYLANNLNVREVSHNELKIDGAVADNRPSVGINVIVDPDLPEKVIGNKIIMPEGGIGIEYEYGATGSSLIANNQIIVNAGHREKNIGISLSRGNINLLYNSVLIYGEDVNSRAFDFSENDYNNFLLQNNLFVNMAKGYAIYSDVYNNQQGFITRYSHNNLYTNGQILAKLQNDTYENLDEWQAVFTNDNESISVDPQFIARDKLMPVNTDLKGAALSSDLINTDFFGRERQQPPTVGAVELLDENGNILPLTDAGDDRQLKLPIETVPLSGKSVDPDGRLVAYQWEKISGPEVTLRQANTANLQLSELKAGKYIFRFTATDNEGGSSSDEVEVHVEGDETAEPMLVEAGEDRTIQLPVDRYVLSGRTIRADARILAYQWEKISGPEVTLQQANTANLILTQVLPGEYVFRFTAKAEGGLSASDEVRLIFEGDADQNQTPTANAGPDKKVALPISEFILRGSGNDPDGVFRGFLWEKVSGPSVTLQQANTANLRLTDLEQGVYVFRFTVTDDDGATASDEVQLTVEGTNQLPVVNAGRDRTVNLPAEQVRLSGIARDPDGRFIAFRWEKVSGPEVTLNQAHTANLILTDLQEGEYLFRFSATDNNQATASDEVILTVIGASPVVARFSPLKAHAYPNQFADQIQLEISQPTSPSYQLEVYDALGRTYYQKAVSPGYLEEIHTETIVFDDPNMKKGVYFIRVSDASVSKVIRVLKNR
ncbi:MAG: PKD domain-containing protein [Cyclobacteriaceae bacterium]